MPICRRVTLPGMRPNLFPKAENAKPPLGRVSAVSSVNRPIVPVVASIGVNTGAGLYSSSFFALVASCGGSAEASVDAVAEAPASSDLAASEVAVVSAEFAESAASTVLESLEAFAAGLLEKPAGTSKKIKINNPATRIISRNMSTILHDYLDRKCGVNVLCANLIIAIAFPVSIPWHFRGIANGRHYILTKQATGKF